MLWLNFFYIYKDIFFNYKLKKEIFFSIRKKLDLIFIKNRLYNKIIIQYIINYVIYNIK